MLLKRTWKKKLLNNAPPLSSGIKEKLLQTLEGFPVTRTAVAPIEKPVRSLLLWKLTAAASLIFLGIALSWGYRTQFKYKNLQQEIAVLEQKQQQTVDRLAQLQAEAGTIQKPGIRIASLQGTNTAPAAQATVYWDSTTTNVYLVINNLPQPASNKQYQLWALADGKPIDLGVVELRQTPLLIKMKGVQKAQAFAITLEPKGGSLSPTLEAMQVMGKLTTL